MPERRMANVMNQGETFDQIDVQSELRRDRARYLRHLERVGQASAKVVGIAAGENLGLGFKPSKGPRVDDAVAVPLKVIAVRMGRFRMAAAAGVFHRVACEHVLSVAK